MKKRAALILRVSSDVQDFSRQKADLKAIALEYLIEDDDIYAEKISGTIKADERSEMIRLKQAVESGKKKYSMIFAQEVSRIGRNPLDARHTVEWFADRNIPIYIQNLGQCSINPDGTRNSIFHMIYGIMAELAKNENDVRSMRVKSGILNKVRNGGVGVQAVLPYGFNKDENKRLIIDQEEAPIVAEMYQMVLDGLGTKQIAHSLNSRNIPTRIQKISKKGTLKMKNSKIEKDIANLKWVDGVVYSILINPINKGKRRFKGELVDVPAIVSEETWEKVNQTLKERFDTRVRDTRWLYLLGDRLMMCGVCGKTMYGRHKRGGKDSYYQCLSCRTGSSCGNSGIGISVIESCVFHSIKNTGEGSLHDFYLSSNELINKHAGEIQKLTINLDIKEKKLNESRNEIESLNFMFRKGKLNSKKWETEVEKIEEEIKSIQLDVESVKAKIKGLKALSEKLKGVLTYKNFRSNLTSRIELQKVFQTLIKKVVVTSVGNTKNNNRHVVSIVFINGYTDHLLVISKPNGSKAEKFVGEEEFKIKGHGRCKYFFEKNLQKRNKNIKVDAEGRLITKVEDVAEFLLNSEHQPVVPDLIEMEEINLKSIEK